MEIISYFWIQNTVVYDWEVIFDLHQSCQILKNVDKRDDKS